MFKRRKKTVILILDQLQTLPLMKFSLPEPVIIDLSTQLFNDPEPCHIHREAVRQRFCMHLMDACLNRGEVAVSTLPPELRQGFPDSKLIELREEIL